MEVFMLLFSTVLSPSLAQSVCISQSVFEETIQRLEEKISTMEIHASQEKQRLEKRIAMLENQARAERQTRLTVPVEGQVAFSVALVSSLWNLGDHQTLLFDTVITNLGNAYDKRVGVFTARTSGWYVFSLTIMTHPYLANEMEVVVNGEYKFRVYSQGNEYSTASRTMVLRLMSGDEVWVRRAVHSFISRELHGDEHTSFTGWLLYASGV